MGAGPRAVAEDGSCAACVEAGGGDEEDRSAGGDCVEGTEIGTVAGALEIEVGRNDVVAVVSPTDVVGLAGIVGAAGAGIAVTGAAVRGDAVTGGAASAGTAVSGTIVAAVFGFVGVGIRAAAVEGAETKRMLAVCDAGVARGAVLILSVEILFFTTGSVFAGGVARACGVSGGLFFPPGADFTGRALVVVLPFSFFAMGALSPSRGV